jgi:hypothetical protein
MRLRYSQVLAILCSAVLLQSTLSFAADNKKKPAEKPTELTDNDKKKLAEIEARPDVKTLIENEWRARRQKDLDYLYRVNTTERMGNLSGPEYAEFIQNYHQLYNNPMLQRYLNAIGQRLVPKNSPNTYAFKLVLNPVPTAQAYSTGTVLVSTGLVSMLDNQAQLAYVLGHEITHIEKKHEYDIIRMQILEEKLKEEKEAEAKQKRALIGALVTAAGAGIGAVAGGGSGALLGGAAGFLGSTIATSLLIRDRMTYTAWSDQYEDDADANGLKLMLDQNYDVRESPKLYARLQKETTQDPRVGLGFIADDARMRARVARINALLSGEMKAAVDAKLSAGLTGSSGEFNLMMAALKRDNGIVAIDYDLFDMARDNLEEAVALRGNDSLAQQNLGRVISITARDVREREEAEAHFLKAIQYDEGRGAYPEPHLEHALHLLGENGDKNEIRKEVEAYVALYQREHGGSVPGNIRILYDYLTMSGEPNWYAAPAAVVSTKYVEPLHTSGGGGASMTGAQVVTAATGTTVAPPSTPVPTQVVAPPEAKRPPVVHKVKAAQ